MVMRMIAISTETLNSIQELVRVCFESNAKVDTIVNRMDVVFNMPKSSEIVHLRIAHAYPTIFADAITDFLAKRCSKVNYGNIPLQNKDYTNAVGCFGDLVEIQDKIEEQTCKAIEVAEQNNDMMAKIFLENFLTDVVLLYSKQAMILLEKAKEYEQSDILALLDNNIESLIIVPIL